MIQKKLRQDSGCQANRDEPVAQQLGKFFRIHVTQKTSVSFVIWHLSAISLDTGFDIPANEIPVFLVNATLLSIVFGFLRMISGSVIVASVCHAVWNAIDYPLYGFGEKVGILGVVINSIAALALWSWWRYEHH